MVSVFAGAQIGYYLGSQRTPSHQMLNRSGNANFIPPYPQNLVGYVSWNSSTISQNQTIEVKESITNPLFGNSTVVVPYAECITEIILSLSNGSQIFGPGSQITTCLAGDFNDTMNPGQSSNVSFIVGFRDNVPPTFSASWESFGNTSDLEYSWPLRQDLASGQYELIVNIFHPSQGSVSIVIPINIIV